MRQVVRRVDADIWAFQEVYRFQRRHLERTVLPVDAWGSSGEGRRPGGKGEQVPIFHRRADLVASTGFTRWFGPTPELVGSRAPGAALARVATVAMLTPTGSGTLPGPSPAIRVVNVHLDSESVDRRAAALAQLAGWLDEPPDTPTIVMGDFNGPSTDPGYELLGDAGLRAALVDGAGPTSNGFGRRLDRQDQIDHVFVSSHFDVRDARIDHEAGHASDHYPLVVDLAFSG